MSCQTKVSNLLFDLRSGQSFTCLDCEVTFANLACNSSKKHVQRALTNHINMLPIVSQRNSRPPWEIFWSFFFRGGWLHIHRLPIVIDLGAFFHACHRLHVSLAVLLDILIDWIYPLIHFYWRGRLFHQLYLWFPWWCTTFNLRAREFSSKVFEYYWY